MSTEQTASETGSCLCTAVQYEDYICIMAGTLDRPTQLQASGHIFVGMASDYYQIADGLPQYAQGDSQAWADKGD